MIDRLKPSPTPAVNPVPEYRVEGRTRELYQDTKAVLQVPWMGVVTMAFAHYLPFYEELWRACRPIMASESAVTAWGDLRTGIEARVRELDPPPAAARLADMGYAPREIDSIRETITVFSHGNFPYCMIATLARLALEADTFPAQSPATAFGGRHAPDVEVPFVLIEPHHADDQTRDVYASVRETLGLPFVNTDYRALARWPTYFRMAWGDLAPICGTGEYEAMVRDLHEQFVTAAMAMPNPDGVTAAGIRAAAEKAGGAEVLDVVRLFQWLLPGLITNVAFFRAQLEG